MDFSFFLFLFRNNNRKKERKKEKSIWIIFYYLFITIIITLLLLHYIIITIMYVILLLLLLFILFFIFTSLEIKILLWRKKFNTSHPQGLVVVLVFCWFCCVTLTFSFCMFSVSSHVSVCSSFTLTVCFSGFLFGFSFWKR